MNGSLPHNSTETAVEAMHRGFQAVPIANGGKRPYGSAWTHLRWDNEEQVRASFNQWATEGAGGVGLLLGDPSDGLVDIDLDHPKTLRMRDYFLPPSAMQTGRAGRPRSHRWYKVTGTMPGTRRYKMPDGSVSVELRATGAQTVIPPSIHPSGESYRWEGEEWGGDSGPEVVDGNKLAIQVALLGLGAVLLDAWPKSGGRHDAYLALAGGLLRFGEGVHPYWERNLPVLISALAEETNDEDGPEARVSEVMGSTLGKLRAGNKAVGFPRLAEMIGVDHAELVRRMAREVEQLGGFTPDTMHKPATSSQVNVPDSRPGEHDHGDELVSTLPPVSRNPLEERLTSWDQVDLGPYLSGEIVMPEPSVLTRTDGKGIFYPGRVNSLYGKSESAKSWISLFACVQEIGKGERVVYIDLEDEPAGTLKRIRALGVGDDDIQNQFAYVHPEGPIAEMQKYQFGASVTDDGQHASDGFRELLTRFDPTLIVADGMTVLYGLHGHDTNAATATDVITSWLKSLTRGGRSTVIVIDHTGKGSGPGTSPIGAHHKVAMVQGTAIRADAVQQPMPGELGTIQLVVYKDRPGVVRSYSTRDTEQVAGVVTMDSRVKDITRMVVDVPEEGNVVIGNSDEMEQKLAELAAAEELHKGIMQLFGGDLDMRLKTVDVIEALGVTQGHVYDAWAQLKMKKQVVQEGSTRWTKFRLATPAEQEGERNDEAGK